MTGAVQRGLRRQFAALARDPKRRVVGGVGRPHRWRPNQVPADDSGYGMTDAAAWALLAAALEDVNQKLETLPLDKPPGAIGYVMKVRMDHLPKRLYTKFEFFVVAGVGVICGRSFHLEDPR
jgi:hypothetical protein